MASFFSEVGGRQQGYRIMPCLSGDCFNDKPGSQILNGLYLYPDVSSFLTKLLDIKKFKSMLDGSNFRVIFVGLFNSRAQLV